jgi:hypothetical protein
MGHAPGRPGLGICRLKYPMMKCYNRQNAVQTRKITMTTIISVTELAENLPDFIARVGSRREHFLIREGDKTLAELGPAPPAFSAADLSDLFSTLPKLSASELKDFEKDLAEIRNNASQDRGRNPWES